MLAVGATSASANGINILTNGSFEDGIHRGPTVQTLYPNDTEMNGWKVISGSVDWIYGSVWPAQAGNYSLDMNGYTAGTIEQNFSTTIGATYLVQFYLGANPGANPTVTLSVKATGGLSQGFIVSPAPSVTWTKESYTFTATQLTTTLTIAGDPNAGASGPALDNVSVTAVAPTIASAAINGIAQVGETLTAMPGNITGFGATPSYQWQIASAVSGSYTNIGLNASTYTAVAGDAGRFIRVIITVTNNGGSASQTSASTSMVLNAAPTIDGAFINGTAKVGETFTALSGNVSGGGITTSYQWQGAPAPGGSYTNIGSNASTYTAVAGDAGRFIRVIITVTNNGGSASQTSASTLAVLNAAPTIASAAITGAAQVFSTLTAVSTGITGVEITTSYQWQIASVPGGSYTNIGLNASSYSVVAGDAGRFIRVIITVTNNGGSASQTSASTSMVLNGEQCKKGGWQGMSNSFTGLPFRNQGACVSYFATRGLVPIGS